MILGISLNRLSQEKVLRGPLAFLTLALLVVVSALLIMSKPLLTVRDVLFGYLLTYLAAIGLLFWFRAAHLSRLERLAMTDSLCGLPNRRALRIDIANAELRDCEIAVAIIDLDGFKAVNDFYGHSIGDQTLIAVSDIFATICGEEARVYRMGGDEFALLVCDPLAGNILEGRCRRMLDRLADPIRIEDRAIVLGASIGLTKTAVGENVSSGQLLRRADVAMYAAKEQGKRRITWFREEFDRSRDAQQKVDEDLRLALKDGQLRVFYQPLIDAHSAAITSVEALIRWQRADGSWVSPDQFIPVAEESGFIEAIGNWVLRQACLDAREWGDVTLSVNVSTVQLRNPQFPLQMGQILEETGFPPHRLELEITESFLIGDQVVASRNLQMIREFGVSVVLDDYGTGYASIGFLRRFRFEKLKLDRSLISGASIDPSTRAVMASSVAIAKALGMKVTAEGIETEVDADMARVAGCDQMQGWLYSKAIPANAIRDRIVDDSASDDADKHELQPVVALTLPLHRKQAGI